MSSRLQRLHTQCKIYHLKRTLKGFVALLLLVSLPFSIYYIYDFFLEEEWQKSAVVVQTEVTAQAKQQSTEQKRVSLSYLPAVSAEEVEKAVKKIETKTAAITPPPVQKVQEKQRLQISESRSEAPKKNVEKVYFSVANEDKSLEEWEQKYNKKKSYSIAIYIAKEYYQKEDFKDAGIWAKRANQHDRNKEDAWILYAKSVFALGDKEKAKKILNIFLQYKDSAKTELLLSEWGN